MPQFLGKHILQLKLPRVTILHSNGDFVIDKQGFLATREGFRVMGDNGEINLQEELIDRKASIMITKNGEIKSGDRIVSKLKMMKVGNESSFNENGRSKIF